MAIKKEQKTEIIGGKSSASRNEHLGFMAQMISHNLRSPVAGLKMLLPLFERVRDDEEQEELVDQIRESSEVLFRMINDLAVVLMDYQHLSSPKAAVKLEGVVNEVILQKEAWMEELGGRIHTDFKVPGFDYYPEHMKTIFSELIDNALKFCPPARPPEIHIKSFREEGRVIISIEDNAAGIDLEVFERDLFKMYRSLQDQTDDGTPTGKGLFRVKNIVEINGGRIWLESLPEVGSTFYIELNLEQP